jgi:tetratricopeptide (TPR) repeat protein
MAFDADIETKTYTAATPATLAAYEAALHQFTCYAGDPFTPLNDAIAEAPGFVRAHILKAWMPLIGSDRPSREMAAAAYHDAQKLPMNRAELGHVTAIGKVIDGEIKQAARILEDVSVEDPTDVLALQMGALLDFLVGDSRMLRDRIGRALPYWSEAMPHYHAILGMHAFGLEEMGQYARAEAAGRKAVELEPRNSWAQHAVAHVLEMQDRRREGIAWMTEDVDRWARDNFFAVHNWWHLALFHLGLGEVDKVLELYDGPIFGNPSSMEFDMVDASAMLWRLTLLGVDVGDRWTPVADQWQAVTDSSYYGFNDAHAAMALVGAGRSRALTDLVKAQAEAILGGGDNVEFVREVASPLVQGIIAFGDGDYRTCLERLRPIRSKAHRFGGSHAQRDLIDLTIIEAARRGGQDALARALVNEREQVHPR